MCFPMPAFPGNFCSGRIWLVSIAERGGGDHLVPESRAEHPRSWQEKEGETTLEDGLTSVNVTKAFKINQIFIEHL